VTISSADLACVLGHCFYFSEQREKTETLEPIQKRFCEGAVFSFGFAHTAHSIYRSPVIICTHPIKEKSLIGGGNTARGPLKISKLLARPCSPDEGKLHHLLLGHKGARPWCPNHGQPGRGAAATSESPFRADPRTEVLSQIPLMRRGPNTVEH
jgi:hypothetical protein